MYWISYSTFGRTEKRRGKLGGDKFGGERHFKTRYKYSSKEEDVKSSSLWTYF